MSSERIKRSRIKPTLLFERVEDEEFAKVLGNDSDEDSPADDIFDSDYEQPSAKKQKQSNIVKSGEGNDKIGDLNLFHSKNIENKYSSNDDNLVSKIKQSCDNKFDKENVDQNHGDEGIGKGKNPSNQIDVINLIEYENSGNIKSKSTNMGNLLVSPLIS